MILSRERLASHLNKINDDRKWMVANVLKEIKHTLSSREERKVIVIGNPNWRVGILGIAANNLVEEYGKPAFVWGRGESRVIKGSCRSDGSVNLVELMTSVSEGVFWTSAGTSSPAASPFLTKKSTFWNRRFLSLTINQNATRKKKKF